MGLAKSNFAELAFRFMLDVFDFIGRNHRNSSVAGLGGVWEQGTEKYNMNIEYVKVELLFVAP